MERLKKAITGKGNYEGCTLVQLDRTVNACMYAVCYRKDINTTVTLYYQVFKPEIKNGIEIYPPRKNIFESLNLGVAQYRFDKLSKDEKIFTSTLKDEK